MKARWEIKGCSAHMPRGEKGGEEQEVRVLGDPLNGSPLSCGLGPRLELLRDGLDGSACGRLWSESPVVMDHPLPSLGSG